MYLDLADALLHGATLVEAGDASIALLFEARTTVERLKAAELRDYFRDECIVDLEAKTTTLEKIAGTAAIVYPILFKDRIELLVSLPSGLTHYPVYVTSEQVNAEAHRFQKQLLNLCANDYQDTARQLYDWLVRPYAVGLPQRVSTRWFSFPLDH